MLGCKEIYQKNKQLIQVIRKDNNMKKADFNKFYKRIADAQKENRTLEELDLIIQEKKDLHNQLNSYVSLLSTLLSRKQKELMEEREITEEQKQELYQLCKKIVKSLKRNEINQLVSSSVTKLRRWGLDLSQISSFNHQTEIKKRQRHMVKELSNAHKYNSKSFSHKFARKLGLKVPQRDENVYEFHEVVPKSGTVVKPTGKANSRGVFLILSPDNIVDVSGKRTFNSWASIRDKVYSSGYHGIKPEENFIVEELITEDKEGKMPGRDFKFYCFYGKVALILESIRYPEMRRCWWTADGQNIDVGKYNRALLNGIGVSQEEIDTASYLSYEIPLPFIRLDFIKSYDGIVFCESHTTVGGYSSFNEKTDQWLGDMYLEAEGRLLADLLNGKTFNTHSYFFPPEMSGDVSTNNVVTTQLLVEGKVQKVGYRKWVKKKALRLGVDGHAKNLKSGAVRIVLRGPSDTIEKIRKMCWEGPRKARVKSIKEKEWTKKVKSGFLIL